MKFFDNIMRAIGLKEEEDNEFEFDDEKKDNVVPMFGTKSYGSESHRGYETNRYEESRHTGRDNLIAMPHAQKSVSVVVVEPIGFDEVQKMADYLRNNQPVVINFENTDNDVRKRIVDFISGTIYALMGLCAKLDAISWSAHRKMLKSTWKIRITQVKARLNHGRDKSKDCFYWLRSDGRGHLKGYAPGKCRF